LTSTSPDSIFVLSAAAPAVDAEARSALGPVALAAAERADGISLVTCHRVELIAADALAVPDDVHDAFERTGARSLWGDAAIDHVIALALGLESAALAEDQVLHQLRQAVASWQVRTDGRSPVTLDRLLRHALRAGRVGRSWRPARAASLADLALDRIEAIAGPLADRRSLIVGAGRMGTLVTAAAAERGARIALASPSMDHATRLSLRHGAEVWPLDPTPRALADVDSILIALSGPWRVARPTLRALPKTAVVVDLSMPPALDSVIAAEMGERAIDIDDLARSTGAPSDLRSGMTPSVERYRARLHGLLVETRQAFLADVAARDEAETAGRLAERVESMRRTSVETFLRERPELGPAAQAVMDDLTRDLSARLFRAPLARLARDPDGRRREALDELFGP